jgi:non-heme chloroperoxidase
MYLTDFRQRSGPIARNSIANCRKALLWLQRPVAKSSEAAIANWWRQGMMGGAKARYDSIVAFSQTDFTEDLKKITVPVLVMHSNADAGPLSAKLLKNGTLKTYKNFPHGMPTTEAVTINADLLAFIAGKEARKAA